MPDDLQPIKEIEIESIRFWAEVADFLGFPMSSGEAFGHLFISEKPLSADEIALRTGTSRSGSGQHLKLLVEIGAIRISQAVQHRKTHYELQTDLGILVRRLSNTRIFPKLAELNQQRLHLQNQASDAEAAHLIERFKKLDRWKQKIEPLGNLLKSLI
jgi:DNA-binding transcriptional regulator GbsR (MarR family)